MNWTTLLTTLLTSTVLLGIVGWLIRSLFGHLLSKDIEKFKARLEVASIEHQIRFTRLHEKQANVIAEIYAKLLPAKFCFDSLRRSDAQDFTEADRKLALKMLRCCIEAYLLANQQTLYLDRRLFEMIIETVEQVFTTAGLYTGLDDTLSSVVKSFDDVPEERRLLIAQIVVGNWRDMEDRITPLLEKLKTEFQTMLGVTKMD
jgi:hypothetical protein